MDRASFNAVLMDLGWIALAQHGLGLRPAEAHALRQLTRHPGVTLTHRAFGDAYSKDRAASVTADAIRKRIERVRTALADVGCIGAITTIVGLGYVVEPEALPRIETAMMAACGYSLSEAA